MGDILMNDFNDEFESLAASGATFQAYFQASGIDDAGVPLDMPDVGQEATSVKERVQQIRRLMVEGPVSAQAQNSTDDLAIAGVIEGADASRRQELYQNIVDGRRSKIVFYGVDKPWDENLFKVGGPISRLLQKSKFAAARGEPGKKNSIALLNAACFPNKDVFASGDAHRKPVPFTDAMAAAMKFLSAARGANTLLVTMDGRSLKVRLEFTNLILELCPDEHRQLDGGIVYTNPFEGDHRKPKKTVYGAFNNREGMLGILPVTRSRMHNKDREAFSACGESSTSCITYSQVPFRKLSHLPRLSHQDKQAITGVNTPDYDDEDLTNEFTRRGYPLFLHETLDIDFYISLFKDHGTERVFDLTPGSGAAAMAAHILGDVHYEGVCMNEKHASWLNRLLDKGTFAVVFERDAQESKALRSDIRNFFINIVEEGRVLKRTFKDDTGSDEDVEVTESLGGPAAS